MYLGMSLLTMLLIGANLSEPYTSVLNAADCYVVPAIHTYDYIPYPNSMMAKNLFYCPTCTYIITRDCAVILPCTWPGRMTEAEWLIDGMLSMCDERYVDRGETLSLKKNEKLGFAGEERQR